ncbi:hypothetical protein ApAK_06080 [Thermoplasmatales archaeon AK]|nr:hypothetical protein [Thermoplasmatales archaeon AK]
MKIQYSLEMSKPQSHFLEVTMRVEDFSDDTLVLTMPAWTPGSYEIMDFARFVRNLHATADGVELEAQKKDKSTWKVATKGNRSIRISYEVFAHELDVHTSHLDSHHAFINGTGVFFYIDGYKDQSAELVIKPPSGWGISTGLEKLGENRFRAVNYDILVDSPIEIGNHRVLNFQVDGKEHEIVLCGSGNEDAEKLKADVKKIVEGYAKLFGHLPYKKYVFIYHLVNSEEERTGGLEHLNSTAINVDRFTFSPFEKYKSFLSVTSHEFFHLWNVKRIRPVELGPFNYREENYTTMLWMAEGFTNFYGYLMLYRVGLIDQKEYLKHICESMRTHDLFSGSFRTSASESSFDTWVKLYKPTPNNYNNYVSYYLKGELLGFMLNARIIEATNGSKSLDDFYRHLMDKFNKDGKGYTEKDVLTALKEISGKDFSEFYETYVRKPTPVDFEAEMKRIGLVLKKGYKKIDDREPESKPSIGLIIRNSGGKYVVDGVIEGSPAEISGIAPKDELVAVEGFRFNERFVKEITENARKLKMDNLMDFEKRGSVKVHFFRDGELHETSCALRPAFPEYYEASEDANASPSALTVREKFFSR